MDEPAAQPGLYDCVVLDDPGWCPAGGGGKARGLGDRVGDEGTGDGDGVLAKGDRGMWPTDLRRFGEWTMPADLAAAAECWKFKHRHEWIYQNSVQKWLRFQEQEIIYNFHIFFSS